MVAATILKSFSFANGFAVGVLLAVSLELVANRFTFSFSCNAIYLHFKGYDKYQEKNKRNTSHSGHRLLNIAASTEYQ